MAEEKSPVAATASTAAEEEEATTSSRTEDDAVADEAEKEEEGTSAAATAAVEGGGAIEEEVYGPGESLISFVSILSSYNGMFVLSLYAFSRYYLKVVVRGSAFVSAPPAETPEARRRRMDALLNRRKLRAVRHFYIFLPRGPQMSFQNR